MVKRVLGNDPFSPAGPAAEPKAPPARAGRRPAASPAGGAPAAASRASKRPAAGAGPREEPAPRKAAGKAPRARKGGGSDGGGGVTPRAEAAPVPAPVVEAPVAVPRAPAVPAEALVGPEDEPTTPEESTAPADLPPDVVRRADDTLVVASASPGVGGDIEDQIREIEARLDRLLRHASTRGERGVIGQVADRLRARIEPGTGPEDEGDDEDTAAAPAGAPPRPPTPLREESSVFDVARELLSSDYYLRQWGRVAMRDRTEEVDEFGLDPKYAARWRPFFDFLYERWWRIETHDIDRVPHEGRVILCANHSGAVPYDGAMLATALRREHPARRELRWLAEDFVFHFPFLGVFMNRIGAVRACQENAERLLKKDTVVGVFPEGVKGISKLYRDRYRLQRFGRGGHVKLAIRTRTPIVPVAIVGAEETHPLIAPTGLLAKLLGVPYVPITPTFPWLGPAGLVPVPSKWKMFFLEPISMEGYGPEAADDEVLVGRLNEKIRTIIQDELDHALRQRRSVFRG